MIRLSVILVCFYFQLYEIEAQNLNSFENAVDVFLKKYVKNDNIQYGKIKRTEAISDLIKEIAVIDHSALDKEEQKAFYINAYNLSVIHKIVQKYPLGSVMVANNFFDSKNIQLNDRTISLNHLEKEILLKQHPDPRLHFVLVCGAKGCPPIMAGAYKANNLEQQLESQTNLAINDPSFVTYIGTTLEVSKIFEWYQDDFGGSESAVISFINKYKKSKAPKASTLKYFEYDWTLNDANTFGSLKMLNNANPTKKASNNSNRYVVSSTIPKGTAEIKLFNNLYSQQTGDQSVLTDRSTFFTTILNAIYGVSDVWNIGITGRYRRVSNDPLPSSAFDVFDGITSNAQRQGITGLGPTVRYAPVRKWSNFSIQSSFVLAIGNELSGGGNETYIDWNGPSWQTQFFNDFAIGDRFSLFTELDLFLEDIGKSAEGHINRFSTPATLIFSFNPSPQSTLYSLFGYSPFWQSTFDYFVQYGLGAKYQIQSDFELEVLVTKFSNKSLSVNSGKANTMNFGIRYNL